VDQRDVVVVAEQGDDLLGLVLAHQAVSTKTQVSWSPIASWISTAATELSTPPDRPQITGPCRPARGFRAIAGAEGRHGPVALAAAMPWRTKLREQLGAVGRVHHFGVELVP
jgi:hypothetical protein